MNGYYQVLSTAQRKRRNRKYFKQLKQEPARYIFWAVKGRAKKKRNGRAFAMTLTFDEFLAEIGGKLPARCPILGIPLHIAKGFPDDNSFSVDRIDNGRPYEKGNVAIMSRRANFLKRDGTADEHRRIARWMDKMAKRRRA